MMNKKRLAVLAMSAVMTASTVSMPVNAMDFSDGAQVKEATDVATFSSGSDEKTADSDVEAPAVEITEDTADAAGVEETASVVDEDSIVFYYNDADHKDFLVEYETYSTADPADRQQHTATATEWKREAATCDKAGQIWLQVEIGGKVYYSKTSFDVKGEPALGENGHKYVENRDYIVKPTHNKTGRIAVTKKCSVCGDEKVEIEVAPCVAHTWSTKPVYASVDNIKTDDDGNVIFDANGEAVLKDDSKDGSYDIIYYCTDTDCEAERATMGETKAYKSEHKVVYAKTGIYAMIIDYDKAHIATNLINKVKYYNPTQQLPLIEDDIELKDCRVGGWYVVEYYNKDGQPLSKEEKFEVEPHHYHTFTTAEFKTVADKNQCEVTHNKDGALVVTNDSCYRTITYYEVTHCEAKGCVADKHTVKEELESTYCYEENVVSRIEKTAEPTGDHVIKQDVYNEIEKLSKGTTYSQLLDVINTANAADYVKLSASPDCSKGGTVTVSYICVLDGKTVVKEQKVTVVPTDHKAAPAVRENYVAPTCDKNGSYDAVVKCKYCGAELERRTVQIPRLTHTNEIKGQYELSGIYEDDAVTDTTAYLKFIGDKVVDVNGECLNLKGKVVGQNEVGAYGITQDKSEFSVQVGVYTKCTECGTHEVKLVPGRQNTIKLTVVDVQKQSSNGKAGSITLEATYKNTKDSVVTEKLTVPYFTTIEAYQGRVEEEPTAPINGLHLDADGIYRYYVDGVFQSDYTNMIDYAGKKLYVVNGLLATNVSGLMMFEDTWYYLNYGEVANYTGLVMYDDCWFYVSGGILDTNVNGLVPYNGGTFLFIAGYLAENVNGLWMEPNTGEWYYLSLGRVVTEYTGVAMYDNAFFYIRNGKLARDYNGTVEYDGATFKVSAGQLYGPIKK